MYVALGKGFFYGIHWSERASKHFRDSKIYTSKGLYGVPGYVCTAYSDLDRACRLTLGAVPVDPDAASLYSEAAFPM